MGYEACLAPMGWYWFIFSIPVNDFSIITQLLINILQLNPLEEVSLESGKAYYLEGLNKNLPTPLWVVAAEDRIYLCGSAELASSLYVNDEPRLKSSAIIPRSLSQYGQDDLTVIFDPSFVKPALIEATRRYNYISPDLIEKYRCRILSKLTPDQVQSINLRLRWRLGIADIEQGFDYLECWVTSLYEILFAQLSKQVQLLDGLAFSIKLGEHFQKARMGLYSQSIQAGNMTQTISQDELKTTLAHLPGSRSQLHITGRKTTTDWPSIRNQWLQSLKAKYREKHLPLDYLNALETYFSNRQTSHSLQSKIPWTLETYFTPPASAGEPDFNTIFEYIEHQFGRLLATSTLTVYPRQEAGFLENHFLQETVDFNDNETHFRQFLSDIGQNAPFYNSISQTEILPTEGTAQKIVLENVYTTKTGLFGYNEHEWINRKILNYRTYGEYLFAQYGNSTDNWLNDLENLPLLPLGPALEKLLSILPDKIHDLQVNRVLNQVETIVDFLTRMEDLAHLELDTYLEKIESIISEYEYEEEQLWDDLLDTPLPIYLLSVNSDESNEIYAVLLGNLRYPRPKVMKPIRDFLSAFILQENSVGGGMIYQRSEDGFYEIGLTQNTEALGLLVRTIFNHLFVNYINNPGGIDKLKTTFMIEGDGDLNKEESLFYNVFWDFLYDEM